ncbi:MAG: DUF1289 domain-containing protein [Marinomonas sp.]
MKKKAVSSSSDETIQSPCIRQCTLNEADVCMGCFRTINDILNWQASTNEQKENMLSTAQQRQQNFKL